MTDTPVFPFYVDLYFGDTRALTTEEHGAYLLLLFAMWRAPDKMLPADQTALARMAGLTPHKFKSVWAKISVYFDLEGGQITQKKLQKIYKNVEEKRKKNSDAANARWLKTNETEDANASSTHMHTTCETDARTRTRTRNLITSCASSSSNTNIPVPPVKLENTNSPNDPATPVDASWTPTDSTREQILKMGVNVDRELPPFRAWHAAKGTKMLSWDAAFISWCNRAPRTTTPTSGAATGSVPRRMSDPKDFDDWFRKAYAGKVAPNGIYYDHNGHEAPRPAHVYRPQHHDDRGPEALDKWFRNKYAGTVAPNGVRYDDDGEPVLGAKK
jgi:uncharacterized protein YdaU (DUF1376 family)